MDVTHQFPKGLKILLVDVDRTPEEASLRHPQLLYSVTAVSTLDCALACLSGGSAAYDCVVLEFGLVRQADGAQVEALFLAADLVQVPVVLMAEAPTQEQVMQGIQLGAAEFLERPLSFQKLRTLWQHKIRKMMMSANGGAPPRAPSCPQLAPPSDCPGLAAPPGITTPRLPSVQALSCPATPSQRHPLGRATQPSSSLASGDSCSQQAGGLPCSTPAGAEHSEATSGLANAAPLACLRSGLSQAPPTVVSWPKLPAGTTWGTPSGCGILPPPLAAPQTSPPTPAAPSAAPHEPLAIKWCPRGALPLPASSHELLLPEDFSLASLADGTLSLGEGPGPLGLRLTVTQELLSGINAALSRPQLQTGVCAADDAGGAGDQALVPFP